MFDSPFEYCGVCKHYVLLDQTQRQCACEHRCKVACPLQQAFTGIEFTKATNRTRDEFASGGSQAKPSPSTGYPRRPAGGDPRSRAAQRSHSTRIS